MLIVDRVVDGEHTRIGRCETFQEAGKIVDEDKLLRHTVSREVLYADTVMYQRQFEAGPEGCMYEIKPEVEV